MKVKLVAWVSAHKGSKATIFASGKILKGIGYSQYEAATPPQQTLGEIRADWGMGTEDGGKEPQHNELGAGLPDNTPAWYYDDGGEEDNAFVVVEVNLA